MDTNARKRFVDKENPIVSVKRQADLLNINRSSLYRSPVEKVLTDEELFIMRRIDKIHTDEPTWGYRTITRILRRDEKILINQKRTRRIMSDMGIYTIYPKPNLSKRYHSQFIKPYLLRNLAITHVNQVWSIDITYIRMKKGFMYLFVILDWYSRCIVDYELSSTLDKSFVLCCLKRALAKNRPDIINSDQGGHFTNPDYVKLLDDAGVRISMDGRGQCLDNVRTERFFRILKHERIYINEYETPRQLRAMIKEFIHSYNTYRPHSSINGECPANLYYAVKEQVIAS